ncbi:hypothetical protein Tco_0027858, partial [Tanacetum coccineum]
MTFFRFTRVNFPGVTIEESEEFDEETEDETEEEEEDDP